MKTKTMTIAVLLVVNLALLSGLILKVWPVSWAEAGTAYGQAMYGSPRYLMVVGRIQEDNQALYVVNLERRMLATFTFSQSKKKLTFNGRASLAADFR